MQINFGRIYCILMDKSMPVNTSLFAKQGKRI